MKKTLLIISLLSCLFAQAQTVNRFRDSTWQKGNLRIDSKIIYITEGAGNQKVMTSDDYGRATWQTFSASGVTQSALDDSIARINSTINNIGSGSVTSIAAGTGMNFTTITSTGTINADTFTLSTKANAAGLVQGKQNTLVSGTNIKTINSNSLLGSGNINTPDNQTLSISHDTLTISGGNSVVLPTDSIKFGFNAGGDSLAFCMNGVRYSVPFNPSLYATKVNLADTSLNLRNLIAAKQNTITTGTTAQYFRGDLSLATFPTNNTSFTNGAGYTTASSTTTFTNKRITARVDSTSSSATPSINTDNVDTYKLTAQAADITSFTTNLSGTPTDDQILHIVIIGTAARAITWGAKFESSTVKLPTTTVSTNRLDVYFIWNTATSKWRCGGVW